jgi:subtilisin family serine protease/chitodextrinase
VRKNKRLSMILVVILIAMQLIPIPYMSDIQSFAKTRAMASETVGSTTTAGAVTITADDTITTTGSVTLATTGTSIDTTPSAVMVTSSSVQIQVIPVSPDDTNVLPETTVVSLKYLISKDQDIRNKKEKKTGRYIIKYKNDSGRNTFDSAFKGKFQKVKSVKGKNNYDIIYLDSATGLSGFLSELKHKKADKNIEYVQPDFELNITSNDPLYPSQWGIENVTAAPQEKADKAQFNDDEFRTMLSKYHIKTDDIKPKNITGQPFEPSEIGVVEAWKKAASSEVKVAIIDTGIDISHEDLSDNIWSNTSEIPGNGIDDDANRYIDDGKGWDFFEDNSSVYDDGNPLNEVHGTHLAGIIAAEKDNNKGMAGIAQSVKIVPLKVFNNGKAYTSDIIDAIKYAESIGVKIVNCSWGSTNYNQALYDAIHESNMLFVYAAGNNGWNIDTKPVYPASFDCANIITATSLNKYGVLSGFSNYGVDSVDVAAPGEGIQSTFPRNIYGFLNGTSMAAAFVTGEAALLMSINPNEDIIEIKEDIINYSDHFSSLEGKIYGSSKINCFNSVNRSLHTEIIQVPHNNIPQASLPSQDNGEVTLFTVPVGLGEIYEEGWVLEGCWNNTYYNLPIIGISCGIDGNVIRTAGLYWWEDTPWPGYHVFDSYELFGDNSPGIETLYDPSRTYKFVVIANNGVYDYDLNYLDSIEALPFDSWGQIFIGNNSQGFVTAYVFSKPLTLESPKAATPVISSAYSSYTGSQTITITCATDEATIYYTTDGANPTTSSAVYSAPITVFASCTVKAMAVKDGMANSNLSYATYATEPYSLEKAYAEGWALEGGWSPTLYDSNFVGVCCGMDGDGIVANGLYFFGNEIYMFFSSLYIPYDSSKTYKLIVTAYNGSYVNSYGEYLNYLNNVELFDYSNGRVDVGSGTLGIVSAYILSKPLITGTPKVEMPEFSPPAGTYVATQSVNITSATAGSTIYYTTDGTNPTTSSSIYSAPVTIASSCTIKAMAVKSGMVNSDVAIAAYTIQAPARVATPAFSPAAGTYTGVQSVTITSATAGSTIYYTTNGTTPTTESAVYSAPVSVITSSTIKAMAVKSGMANSDVASAAYAILMKVATPAFSPATGTYTGSQSVTIMSATNGTTIYYTTNGMTPTVSSAIYSTPISVTTTSTIKAIAVKSGMEDSDVASAEYMIQAPAEVAMLVFNPAAGTYTSPQSVTITSATNGSTIYYTTNGTTPTTSSAIYSTPITVMTSSTIKAIAFKNGMANSDVASAAYVVNVAALPDGWQKIEAEDMDLVSYGKEFNNDASGHYLICTSGTGQAGYYYNDSSGHKNVSVWYYDETDGISTFKFYVNGVEKKSWVADESFGEASTTKDSKTSVFISDITINNDDQIIIEGTANSGEAACIDYIEISPCDTVKPTAPQNLAVKSTTDNTITLSWTASTDNDRVTGYELYNGSELIGTVSNTLEYTMTGLTTSGAIYEFYVKAKDALGNLSEKSNTLFFTNIVIDNNEANFETDSPWTVSTNPPGFYGTGCLSDGTPGANPASRWAKWTPNIIKAGSYDVYMRWTSDLDRPDAAPLEIAYDGGTDTSRTVNQQNNDASWVLVGKYVFVVGTSGYIKIIATDEGNTIADAVKLVLSESTDTIPPTAPSNLTATSKTDTVINLNWTASSDNVGVTGYEIYNGTHLLGSTSGVTSYSAVGLTPDTEYNLTVKGKDAQSNLSDPSNILSITTNKPLANQFSLSAAVIGTSIVVKWKAIEYATGYDIEIDGVVRDNGLNTSFTHTGLTANTQHSYRVRFRNASGTSDWSNKITCGLNKTNYIISCAADKEFIIMLDCKNISNFNGLIMTFNYNVNELEVLDLSSFTKTRETTVGAISGTDVEITDLASGQIKFKVNKTIAVGETWSGVTNTIRVKCKGNGASRISYSID